MLIEPGQMIAGLPATPLRGLMRELMQCSMSADELRHRLEGNDVDPTGVPDRLVDAGFIRVAERGLTATFAIRDGEDPKTTTLYTTAIAGNALAKARIGKPMTRDKADELLAGLIQRVEDENLDPESLFWIESVSVFGSYADESNETRRRHRRPPLVPPPVWSGRTPAEE